jgi:hypothetical protein
VAIVISGGGNDSTHDEFANLLVPNANPNTAILDKTSLDALVAKIETNLRAVLKGLMDELASIKVKVPIVVHGYDYFYPRGLVDPTWFRTHLDKQGYRRAEDQLREDQACHDLIEALNDMLKRVADGQAVRHVPLQGTVARLWTTDSTQGWRDDLHPHNSAFQAYAVLIDKAIWP